MVCSFLGLLPVSAITCRSPILFLLCRNVSRCTQEPLLFCRRLPHCRTALQRTLLDNGGIIPLCVFSLMRLVKPACAKAELTYNLLLGDFSQANCKHMFPRRASKLY